MESIEFPMANDPRAKREEILDHVRKFAETAYETREKLFSPDLMRQVERMVYLQTVDRLWKDHLYEMDQLKGGIGLRGYGQRDPLVEYKKEGFELFVRMLGQLNREVLSVIFRVRVDEPREQPTGPDLSRMQATHAAASGMDGPPPVPGAAPPQAARPPLSAPPPRAARPLVSAPPIAAPPMAAPPPPAGVPRDAVAAGPAKRPAKPGLSRPKKSGPKARKKKRKSP